MKNLFIDIDGTIAEFHYRPISELVAEGYFANLKPLESNLKELREIAATKEYNCYILSSVLKESEFAESEKRNWLKKNFPEVKEENYLFPKCGESKATILGRSLTQNDVLIDDRTLNLEQWSEAGGFGIKILNQINGLGGRFVGPRVRIENGGELKDLLQSL